MNTLLHTFKTMSGFLDVIITRIRMTIMRYHANSLTETRKKRYIKNIGRAHYLAK